jgi:predicted nucleotidyltransferase
VDQADEAKIISDLQGLMSNPAIEAILLFGSYARGDASSRSDVDICVVAPMVKTQEKMASLLGSVWQQVDASRYDIWLFEELPLYMQMDIIENHRVLCCRDVPSLYEYFYPFRKQWADEQYRQLLTT